ncbi:hypothetical protein DFH11DRAFT_1548193 [Phellopilus nigrolimitatus]|nr:hypothetical protein DFH11DRAFT_1548193 [Phellopilus nigrolimitatus]
MVTVVFTNKGAADIDVSFTDENGKKVNFTVSPDTNHSRTMKENYTYNISFVKQGLEKQKGTEELSLEETIAQTAIAAENMDLQWQPIDKIDLRETEIKARIAFVPCTFYAFSLLLWKARQNCILVTSANI